MKVSAYNIYDEAIGCRKHFSFYPVVIVWVAFKTLFDVRFSDRGGAMQKQYIIRRFNPKDLDNVVKLNWVFLPENYPSFFFLENYTHWPEAFLVAESEGKIVGYVMCRVEEKYYRFSPIKLGHVLSIAVEKKHRRQGIATALMKGAEAGLVNTYGVDLVYLEVRISNEPAISLYKKLDYRVLGIMPKYYSDGEDGYLMVKPVSERADERLISAVLGYRVKSK